MTIEEIHSKYSDLQIEWNKKLKNKAVIYAEGTKPNWELPDDIRHKIKNHTKPAVPKVIANVIAETITIELINEFKYDIRDISERINHDLCFSPSLDTKKEFIFQRMRIIQEELANNELCLTGVIQNYPESIFSENIVQDLYRHVSIKSENDILEIISKCPDLKEGFYHRELEDFYLIYNLNQLIIELELLSLRYEELTSQILEPKAGVSNGIPSHLPKSSEYGLVFKDSESYQLFLFCINSYDKITKVLVSKYHSIFIDDEEEYIVDDHILESFFRIVNKNFASNFSTPMSRIEFYTSHSAEMKRFKRLKSDFFTK